MISLAMLSVSKPDWTSFHRLTERVFGRNLISPLDTAKISITTPVGYLAALGQMCKEGNPNECIRNVGRLGRHVLVTFLAQSDDATLLTVQLYSDLTITETSKNKIFIISANLEVWQKTILEFSKENSLEDLKTFAAVALKVFDEAGMQALFDNYSRKLTFEGLTLTQK